MQDTHLNRLQTSLGVLESIEPDAHTPSLNVWTTGECIPDAPMDGVLRQAGECDALATVFAILQSQRRRYILYDLRQRGALAVEDLAELLAASATSGDRATVPVEDQQAMHIALLHTHLQQLVGAGVVEYDDEGHRVRPAADIPQLNPYLNKAATVDFA